MKTRAAVVEEGAKEFKLMELDVDPPRDGEVHVKWVAAGMCHSDLHLLDAIIVPRFPIVAGHEGAGIVEAVGTGVTRVKEGDHVVASFIPSCGSCRYCATGHANLCNLGVHLIKGELIDGTFRAHDGKRDVGQLCMLGTFAERSTTSQYSLVKVDDWLPLETAALVGCGVPTGWGTAVNGGNVRVGDTCVIYGIGGVGINALQGAVYAGAKYVVVIDPVAFKRETALQFGASFAFATAEEAAAKVNEITWGQGADQALVTVGVVDAKVITDAVDIIGKGGTVVIAGQSTSEAITIQIPSSALVRSEKVIRGCQFGSSNPQYDIVKLLRLWNAGKLKLEELITKRYTLEQVNEGYQDLRDGKIIRGVIDLV